MTFAFKRGSTFDFSGHLYNNVTEAFEPIGDYTVRCDLRSRNSFALVQALTVTVVDAPSGLIRLYASAADTAKWKAAPHELDLRLTDSAGQVLLSNTIDLNIVDRVTQ